jgi:hypothetical protein
MLYLNVHKSDPCHLFIVFIRMLHSKMFFALIGAVYANSINSGSIKNKRLCRACGEFEKVVSKKMEETAAKPKVVEVAARIGPDGRPIPGRKTDYLTS